MTKKEFLNRYLVERKGTDSLKWDALGERFGQDDLLAMWVADMEFKTCDSITEALKRRVEHGVYGYSRASDAYYQAYVDWMERRHHCEADRSWIRFASGCVAAITYVIQVFTQPGDACLILTPVYYPFHNAVKDNGRRLVCVDLDAEVGRFTMNYEAIEKAIVENHVKLFILCSPHNPAGRVWSEEELNQVLAICRRHNVLVCSDEIHQDFTFDGNTFVPALMVGDGKYRDRLITVNSASKTFNLASLLHAQLIISDERLRATYDREIRGRNQTELSIMGLTAAQAGYEGGEEWLESLKEVIWDNYQYLKTELGRELPKAVVYSMEGTYLPLVDLRAYVDPGGMKSFIQGKCRLAVDYGEWFGKNFGGFVRLNMATDPALVREAVARIVRYSTVARASLI